MVITSKSLHRSNIAFVFKQEGFVVPENGEFTILYTGESAKGANFIDDPVMRVKVYHLPKLKMTFTLEGTRFRIDQDNEKELDLNLVSEAVRAFESLFNKHPVRGKTSTLGGSSADHAFQAGRTSNGIESYGFNFDIIYRFDNTLQLNYLFGLIADSDKILEKRDLTALGVQFTLQRPDRSETYFLKIVSPLELVAHINYHFNFNPVRGREGTQRFSASFGTSQLPAGRTGGPDEQKMKELFQKSYEETDEIIKNLKF